MGVAFSDASQHLYATEFFGSNVFGLEPSGAYASIDLTGPWWYFFSFEYVKIAADNSGGVTGGDLYVAGKNGSVYRVDGEGNEEPFSANEPYITGNQLTGFGPGESFSGLWRVSPSIRRAICMSPTGKQCMSSNPPVNTCARSPKPKAVLSVGSARSPSIPRTGMSWSRPVAHRRVLLYGHVSR